MPNKKVIRHSDVGAETWTMKEDGTSAQQMDQINRPATAADSVTGAANANAVITYAAAGAGVSNVVGAIYWSYNAAPTGGLLKIEDGTGNIVFQLDVTAAGPNFISFDRPLKGSTNTALIITLAAAGAAVVGRVNARKWTE